MTKPAPSVNYQELSEELETILQDLQREDVDVDAALKQYQRGLEVIEQLEAYLKTAQNSVKQLQTKFKASA